jgi:hypothetical protein
MKLRIRLGALVGAGLLTFAMFGVASAAPDFATVSDHQASTAENNNPLFWGADCTKLDEGQGDLGAAVDSYVLTADYAEVIVKAGAGASVGDNALTIFDNPTAGQTVWADTNGNNTFDPGGADGDKNISHIIFCGSAETTSSSTTESSTSFTGSVSDASDVPSVPNTATVGDGGPSSGNSSWLFVAVLGALAGSVLVLTPARAKNKR